MCVMFLHYIEKIDTTRDQVTTQSNILVSNFVFLNSVDKMKPSLMVRLTITYFMYVATIFFFLEFGFNQSNFIGYERSDSYSVEVGFLQGSLTNEVSFRAILQSPPVTNTYDVLFENSSVFIINPTNPTAHIFFVLTPDGIAQEFNETFSLRIVDISPALPDGTEMVTEMNGTILDGDG